ncbi:hypothetical protein Esti_000926 [Eimeria stiedai]
MMPLACSFRFQSAAPLTPSSPPVVASEVLEMEETRQEECEALKRKLAVEAATTKMLTQEEKEAACRSEIQPEAEKVERLPVTKAANPLIADSDADPLFPERLHKTRDAKGMHTDEGRRQMAEAAADQLRRAFAELKSCDHDYSVLCPFAWTPLPGDSACKAPNAYIALATASARLLLLIPLEVPSSFELKRILEDKCRINFACVSSCSLDLSQPCPLGWTQQQETCKPPVDYLGPCVEGGLPADLDSADMRRAAAAKCNASFACTSRPPCERDFQQPCPLGWLQTGGGGGCKAAAEYRGPCKQQEKFGALEENAKRAVSKTCQVFWPCANGEALTEAMMSRPALSSQS